MALMHPMYNHQGRSRKVKRKKTASLLAAEKEHQKYLKSMGLDGKRVKRKPQTMITVSYENTIEKKETTIQPNWSPCDKKPKRETDKKKLRYMNRQEQIDLAKKINKKHLGPKEEVFN